MRIKIFSLLIVLTSITFIPSITKWVKQKVEERLPFEFTLEYIVQNRKTNFENTQTFDWAHLENQEFTYLGQGLQCIAFANQDLVLKFFLSKQLVGKKKYPIPKPTHWIASHKKARKKQRELTKERSLQKTMENYNLAFEKMKEKTGLLALHFNADDPSLQVTLIDQEGTKHLLDLRKTSFVIQQKATPVKEKFAKLSNDEREAAIHKISSLLEETVKAGFVDCEKKFTLGHNYGFIGDTPILLDLGKIEYRESIRDRPLAEIEKMQKFLSEWAQ
jgi:hypothetical protein